jgi:hypothetical protein
VPQCYRYLRIVKGQHREELLHKIASDSEEEGNHTHNIPPPPVDQVFKTAEATIIFIHNYTKAHGYAVTRVHSNATKKEPIPTKIYYHYS